MHPQPAERALRGVAGSGDRLEGVGRRYRVGDRIVVALADVSSDGLVEDRSRLAARSRC